MNICFSIKQLLKEQSNDEENKQPMPILGKDNELKPLGSPEKETVSLDKYKIEVEQRVRSNHFRYSYDLLLFSS